MKPFLFTLLLCFSFLVPANVWAQVTDTTLVPQSKPIIKKTVATIFAGAVFAPRLHYYGRTDDLNSNAVLPTVLLQFDSAGIYASGTAVFLNNRLQTMEYAGTIAELGFKFGKKPTGFTGNIYGNKFFYNTTQLPQSALKGQVGTNITYQTKPINITASGSAAFSNRTDFFASGGLNHSFRWIKGKSIFVITPTATANAGSQNFTTTYYKENTVPGVPWPQEEVMENSQRFKLLSYEFSAPVIFARKNFYFIATPTYVIPDNVITIPGHPELSEKADNLFFVNLTALVSIKIKKTK
jgi:hypothetical protein